MRLPRAADADGTTLGDDQETATREIAVIEATTPLRPARRPASP